MKKISILKPRPEEIRDLEEVDSFEFKIGRNGVILRTTELYMCVAVALYDRNSQTGAIIHDMIADPSLEEKIQKFLEATGGGITDIVITGGAISKRYAEKLTRAIEENLAHVRETIEKKFKDRAKIFYHPSSNDTATVLSLDTREEIFTILVGPDERDGPQPNFVPQKLIIKNGREKWQIGKKLSKTV